MSEQSIQIKAGDAEIKGAYSNMMEIKHGKEEFCLDFLSIFPPVGALSARIIMSPGHLKRMIKALQESLQRYEDNFGNVEQAVEPERPSLGFSMK